MKFYEIFKSFSIKILIAEILVFSFIIFIIGFLINREDPLFINSGINSLTYIVPLLVFTLFYGWLAGLFYLILFAGITFFLYPSFPNYFFLWMIFFFLLSSEFHYYWNKILNEVLEKNRFIEEKLRDIAREMTLLKISHDQLEKQYILKPVSLRSIIYEIKEKILKENIPEKDLFTQILVLISNVYGVKSAVLIKYSPVKNHFNEIAKIGETPPFTPTPLIEKAIETNLIVIIEKFEENSDYLAVIPINLEEFIYLVCIKDMEFLNFNLETLYAINLIFYYLLLEIKKKDQIKSLEHKFDKLSTDFLFELKRFFEIYKKFKIESSLVVFILKDCKELENLIELKIRKSSRALDVIESLNIDNNLYVLCILSFTSLLGSENFVERIIDLLRGSLSEEFVRSNLSHRQLPINKKPEDLLKLALAR